MHRSAILAIRSASRTTAPQGVRSLSATPLRQAVPGPNASGAEDNQSEQAPGASTDEVAHSDGAFNAEADPKKSASQIEQSSDADMGSSQPSVTNDKSSFPDAAKAEAEHPKHSRHAQKAQSGGPALNKAKQ